MQDAISTDEARLMGVPVMYSPWLLRSVQDYYASYNRIISKYFLSYYYSKYSPNVCLRLQNDVEEAHAERICRACRRLDNMCLIFLAKCGQHTDRIPSSTKSINEHRAGCSSVSAKPPNTYVCSEEHLYSQCYGSLLYLAVLDQIRASSF